MQVYNPVISLLGQTPIAAVFVSRELALDWLAVNLQCESGREDTTIPARNGLGFTLKDQDNTPINSTLACLYLLDIGE